MGNWVRQLRALYKWSYSPSDSFLVSFKVEVGCFFRVPENVQKCPLLMSISPQTKQNNSLSGKNNTWNLKQPMLNWFFRLESLHILKRWLFHHVLPTKKMVVLFWSSRFFREKIQDFHLTLPIRIGFLVASLLQALG